MALHALELLLLHSRAIDSEKGAYRRPTSEAYAVIDRSYYTMIKVSDIYFRVALDTASSDLWIISSACQSRACRTVPRYPLLYQSPTFVSIASNATAYQVSYADGTSE